MTPIAPAGSATIHSFSVPEVSAVLRREGTEFAKGDHVFEHYQRRRAGVPEGTPLANVSVLELAVLLAYQRLDHAEVETIAHEIATWTRAPVTADELRRGPIRRLLHIGYLVEDDQGIDLTAESVQLTTTTLRQMVRFVLRDRYKFDLVEIIDLSYESWGVINELMR